MPALAEPSRKRPVDLALNEARVADYAAAQEQARRGRQQWADACADGWNTVHAALGSFADEHCTL